MLCVETIGKIRRRGMRDGESIRGLARSLQLSRNTVRKYLQDGAEPVYKRKPQPGPQLGPWCGRLDEWLRSDRLLPKARRRTARRLFAGLQAARARGKKGGTKFALTKAQVRMAQAAMANRDTSVAQLCKELGISPVTLYRYIDPKGNLRAAGMQVLAKP